MNKVGWEFPANNGGSFGGFNDSGIETYAGKPFMSLAREVIQNSLDAKHGDGKVTVSFEREDISVADLPGCDELRKAFDSCKEQAKNIDNEKAVNFFNHGVSALNSDKISCLRISDYNTTGLRGDEDDIGKQWHAITKASGVSAKESKTAGGSYGIGKYAPFAVSELRTVFYYTKYTEDGASCERAQGKAILMSHEGNNGTTQHIGFYGLRDRCRALNGEKIPKLLRRQAKREDDEGTTLLILGLKESKNWHDRITTAVIANFFYAIDCGDLEVLIDGGRVTEVIDSERLPRLLAKKDLQELDSAVKDVNSYYYAIKHGKRQDKTLPTLGHSILWTAVGEDLPQSGMQSVAIVRNTGMLITDRIQGLIRWPGYDDFVAVCICDSDEGNRLLRDMENPQHDAFEPDRLEGSSKQKEGKKALKELSEWIRNVIKGLAASEGGQTDTITELGEWIASEDETLPGEGDERDPEGKPVLSLKPMKVKSSSPPDFEEEEPDDEGGGGDGEGGSHGTGGGGSGGSDGQRKLRATLKVEGVRILPNPKDGKSKRIIFTPKEAGVARLYLSVAGDSYNDRLAIKSSDMGEIVSKSGSVKVRLDANKRVMLDVELYEPMKDALCIALTREDAEERETDK